MKINIPKNYWIHYEDWKCQIEWTRTQEHKLRLYTHSLFQNKIKMKETKIDNLVPHILRWEGGFSDHPNDKGGATMKGVTYRTFVNYRSNKNLPYPSIDDLKNISDEEWMDILREGYWNRWRADEIANQSIANLVVDWVYNSGKPGIVNVQKILGVTADGLVGPKTIEALNNENPKEIFIKIWNARKDFYEAIIKRNPKQEVFRKGWMNRLNAYTYYTNEEINN